MPNKQSGTAYVISAPSGGGKTSLVNELIKLHPKLLVSISHTTRAPRPGETNGVHYHFIDEKTFAGMVAKNDFLEHAEVFGNQYGTSRAWLEQILAQGIDVIMEVDWQGARRVKQLISASVGIFILPPSQQALEQRLRARAQDKESVIAKRMALAQAEISHYHEYDYVIVNDDFTVAVTDLESIIRSRHLVKDHQEQKHAELLTDLLR